MLCPSDQIWSHRGNVKVSLWNRQGFHFRRLHLIGFVLRIVGRARAISQPIAVLVDVISNLAPFPLPLD